MQLKREDFFCYYKDDLKDKADRVKDVIINLPQYDIPDIADLTQEEYDIIQNGVINSIKGKAIAPKEKSRQDFVEEIFLKPAKSKGFILDYKDMSGNNKCDFEGIFSQGQHFGLEVKGGEGNSVTLLYRPTQADMLIVWSHLDVFSNTPAKNMMSAHH